MTVGQLKVHEGGRSKGPWRLLHETLADGHFEIVAETIELWFPHRRLRLIEGAIIRGVGQLLGARTDILPQVGRVETHHKVLMLETHINLKTLMQHKPFHLHHLYLKFKYLDHINQHQVAPGVEGLKLTVFFGGSKAESRPIRYLQRAEEIELNFQLEVHSISASKVEIWLSRANRFLVRDLNFISFQGCWWDPNLWSADWRVL